jgi:hypothetical protein
MAFGDSVRRQGDQRPRRQDSLIIPQELIVEFFQGQPQQLRQNRLRKFLLRRLEEGAIVEDGPLGLVIVRSEQQRLTIANLEDLLGPDEVEQLKDSVEPTVIRTLKVIERGTGNLRRPPMIGDLF